MPNHDSILNVLCSPVFGLLDAEREALREKLREFAENHRSELPEMKCSPKFRLVKCMK
jgi:hypothetical protein